jgi:hypothetical protein
MNIDASKIKIEEIAELLESLEGEDRTKAMEELKNEALRCYTQEQGIKLIINSIYGAFANEYFHFYNIAVAETVTLQGQDAIRFTERMVDKYFKEFFHRDRPLLKELGVPDDVEVPRIRGNVWKYTDTDSGYLIFEECMDAVKWQGSVKDFVLKLNSFRLADYIKKILIDYAKSFHTDNFLDFELETIANNAIWVAKKKYVQNIVWKDGKDYADLSYIKTTGLEIIQSSTPLFCRGKLIDAVKYMFSKGKITEKDIGDLVKLIKEIKREFKLSNIEKISMGRSVSDYQKFIINDQDKFEIQKGCPIHVRAAGYYNYLLNQNPSLKGKYEMIRSGDKLKWYHSTDEVCDVFAYKAGGHPVEFAPKMNIERQFQATILDPLNRIVVPAGLPALNPSLAYTVSLF